MGILHGTPGKKTKKKRHKQSEMLRHHKIGHKEIREAADEYYEDADEAYYEEEADGEYYEDTDGEYYEDDADGEYYEDGTEEEYYEEDADGEYYEEGADEEYYEEEADGEEDANFYEGEIGYDEGDEYYEEDPAYDEAGDEYYEDDEEYYEEDDEDLEYSEEEYEEDEEGYEDDSPRFGRGRKREKERKISVVDILLGVVGIAVAVVVVFSLSIVRDIRNTEAKVDSFEDLILNLEDAGVIGQRGIVAMNIAMLKGGTNIQEEDTVVVIPEDNAVSRINVSLKTASVVKDLKIKFTNASSGKLIASVPFKVLVTTPAGKQETWEDSDQDGIIYYSGIAGGTYTLTMAALDDRYADYQIDSVTQKVEVKSQIEYRKVDVADEVKTEAEVNVAKEDTAVAVQDTVTESVLTDTVEFVTSTVTDAENGTYSEIAKSSIPDPATLTSYFMEVLAQPATSSGTTDSGNSSENSSNNSSSDNNSSSNNNSENGNSENSGSGNASQESQSSEESKTEESQTEESKAEETKTEETKEVTLTGSVSLDKTESSLKVNESVTLKATAKQVTKTKTIKTTTVTGKDPVSETSESEETKDISDKVTWSSSDSSIAEVKDGTVKGLKAGTAKITAKVTVDGKDYTAECTVTVSVEDKLSLSASAITIGVGASSSFNATISPENATVTAASSDEKIAKVSVSGTGITVTGVAAGTAKITVTGSNKLTATCDVTVTAEPALTLSANKLTVGVKKTGTVTVTMVPDTAKITKVESSDAAKATAEFKDKTVTVTGVAAGTCKVTVTGDNGKTAELEVTVVNTAENDTTSKLKDASGNQVYVLENDKYREAVYADYYKDGVKFYLFTAKKQYTGWQTIGGKTYYYKADHTPVTGKQIIQGAEYLFGDDGALATGTPTLGIDVSKWNGSVDWDAVSKSGVSYAIIRCGYRGSSTGALIVDPKFETNISKAKAAGMQVGVYFFTQAVSETEAVEEASMVLSQVSKYSLNYPIYLDVESSGGRGDKLTKEERTAVIRAFCNTIQNSGYSAGVYANKTWLAEKMDVNQLGSFKIWLAQYAAAPTYTGRYNMWQYTSKGTLPGITGDVDMNLSY